MMPNLKGNKTMLILLIRTRKFKFK